MLPKRQSLDVLQHENRRLQLAHQAQEMSNQLVPGVVEGALPDERKSLTGRPPDDNIYGTLDAILNLATRQTGGIAADGGARREIVQMRCRVNGIQFDCGDDIETRLLKTQPQAANA